MRTPNDILRSLGIYLWSSLGDEWEVRFGDLEGDFKRPYLKVESASPMSPRVLNTAVAECRQTFSVVAYPIEQVDNELARLEAGRVQELFFQAFAVGTRADALGYPNNSGLPDVTARRAHPLRIPIWNCEGIPLDQPVPDDARDPRDFARVDQDPSFNVLEGAARDDEAETLYTVVGEVRLTWTRAITVLDPAQPVVIVGSQPAPPTP